MSTSVSAGGSAAVKLLAPCSLISVSEAGSTLGESLTALDSSANDDPDQISCLYLRGGKTPVFVVLIRSWTLAQFKSDTAKQPGPPKPVNGIGTAAYVGTLDEGPVVLVWEHGVAVTIYGPSPITSDQLQFLAKLAVAELDAPK